MDTGIIILLFVVPMLLVGLVVWLIYDFVMANRKILRYETFHADVPVCKKEYITLSEKVRGPQFHDDEYIVYLLYEGKPYCFVSEKLYKTVNVGDIVRVEVHRVCKTKLNEVNDDVCLGIED